MATTRDRALPLIERGRREIQRRGLRQHRVWVVPEHWDADEYDGTLPAAAIELDPRPKVEPISGGLHITKITPAFSGGGWSVADLVPSIDGAIRSYIIAQAPQRDLEPFKVVGIEDHKNFTLSFTLERLPWPLLKGNRRIARAAGTYGR